MSHGLAMDHPAGKPRPPKFLEVKDKSGATNFVKVGMNDDEPNAVPQLKIIQPNSLARKQFPLVSSQLATRAPPKSFDQEPHRFRSVDSKLDTKETSSDYMRDEDGMVVPKYVSTTYNHLPNAPTIKAPPLYPAPKLAPSLPRPYVSPPASSFEDVNGLLHNRTASGKILGHPTRKFCDEAHVPYHPEPLGIASSVVTQGGKVLQTRSLQSRTGYSKPAETWDVSQVSEENNVVQLNDTWSACWDAEARAVYYYNHFTGEASWVPPPRS